MTPLSARLAVPMKAADRRGVIREVPQWVIRHRRKRGERVNRNEQCEALQASSVKIEVADRKSDYFIQTGSEAETASSAGASCRAISMTRARGKGSPSYSLT